MSTIPPNIVNIIKQQVDHRIKKEVEDMEQEMIKKLHERIPEIIAETAVDVALVPQLMELGNIIRFEVHTK